VNPAALGLRTPPLTRTNGRRLRTSGASVLAIGAFVVPIAFAANAAAAPDDSTTTTITAPATSTSTTTASTTTTTGVPTSTTASPPVTEQGVVVVGANGNTIHAEGAIDAQAPGKALAQTGSSTVLLWLTGVTLLFAGALALTFNRRRHLNPYVLRSSRRS